MIRLDPNRKYTVKEVQDIVEQGQLDSAERAAMQAARAENRRLKRQKHQQADAESAD